MRNYIHGEFLGPNKQSLNRLFNDFLQLENEPVIEPVNVETSKLPKNDNKDCNS